MSRYLNLLWLLIFKQVRKHRLSLLSSVGPYGPHGPHYVRLLAPYIINKGASLNSVDHADHSMFMHCLLPSITEHPSISQSYPTIEPWTPSLFVIFTRTRCNDHRKNFV